LPLTVSPFGLIGELRTRSGFRIAGISEAQNMLNFRGESNFTTTAETRPRKYGRLAD